jgi:hypothetical protein
VVKTSIQSEGKGLGSGGPTRSCSNGSRRHDPRGPHFDSKRWSRSPRSAAVAASSASLAVIISGLLHRWFAGLAELSIQRISLFLKDGRLHKKEV